MSELEKLQRAIKTHKPYLLEIDQLVEDLGNGVMRLDLRVYQGFVTDVVIHHSKRVVFKKPNVDNEVNE
jgi:hypothetical protein